ncbi:MAG: cell division protein FtsA [Candidatus Yanofskybacteria bacterium RIFCSPLOWO2_12_FULL_43_11b]|uniref:Cell division protein FtsA n=1 Tax=Candidatus Yanofskybacteria bacterium RIFCSPLOWO2_12_FULL_43_11b TaxID=1802710 RepID=A0A1F8H807_9BACT|nr:MAG: cell division protein FtsA [Candidatus Yanofskybacteria bacterium RIFCSPHIGHO2_01_FULL_43_32]OGN12123.1 MAG: cell division protein FtsA [Candidatus Yanofskybacteria bacterium RIFCSPHIGHO2_02_FULL_43_12]OGN18268.1 MAG: cell division protein FtsA [Candidatus Yanofskybacteria bacterium RIFCSPHIGHO2_12_FULL_43_11]OGN25229.1 MAG: cell division protein FtsA [Candidatus Yanofskybacteria bacterium RIFCSPLOWO2_01_FULL_43_46]OGN33752.1 MAG: cell division protein FtsA [Candidatus Yanofskybacteria 
MARPYIISGIDIGNSQVKVVIAKIDRDTLGAEILGVGSAISNGLRRGTVVDIEETIENVRTAVQRAEAMAGVNIKRAYLAVNGLHIKTQISRGVIAVSRVDGEISQNDIDRVLQAASVVSLPANREVIHILPRNYIVDGTEYVKNPMGMKGVRLESEVFIIDGLSPYLRNMAKCVNENNIEVSGLVFAPLASALAVLDKNQKEYGVMNLDFGGGTSTLTVFEEADLLHSVVLPIGSKHITSDLAVALRTSIDTAERVKIEHGATSEGEDLRKRGNIDLSELMAEKDFVLPRKQLIRVVDARAQELLEMVANELKKISKGMLPAGVVLSGGGANLPGLAAMVKDKLRLPVRIAKPLNLSGTADNMDDPSFSVAAGLITWGIDEEFGGNKGSKNGQFFNDGSFKKILSWLKNFSP